MLAMLVKVLLALAPRAVMAAMHTTIIRASITAGETAAAGHQACCGQVRVPWRGTAWHECPPDRPGRKRGSQSIRRTVNLSSLDAATSQSTGSRFSLTVPSNRSVRENREPVL